MSTATNRAFNFLVGEMTPILQDVIEWRLYPMHGFFCACSFILGEIMLQQTLLRVDLTDVHSVYFRTLLGAFLVVLSDDFLSIS